MSEPSAETLKFERRLRSRLTVFIGRRGTDEALTPEGFAAHEEPDLRTELVAQCREFVELRQRLGRSSASTASDLPVRVGPYDVLRRIAVGGFGEVLEAIDSRSGARVAVKLLREQLTHQLEIVKRFRREIALGRQFSAGIGLVPVIDDGVFEGRPYFVMDRVFSESLADRLKSLRAVAPTHLVNRKKLAIRVCRDVLSALEQLHQQGIVHRDVKPDNILLDGDGRAYLVDLGLAYLVDESNDSSRGVMAGAILYMAPEQVLMRASFDRRTDVYSVGVVLYECLTLRLPLRDDDVSRMISAIAFERPKSPRTFDASIAEPLATICLKALEKLSALRFPSAAAMEAELRRFEELAAINSRPPSILLRSWSWLVVRPHRLVATGAVALIVLAVVTMLIVFRNLDREQNLASLRVILAESSPDQLSSEYLRFALTEALRVEERYGESVRDVAARVREFVRREGERRFIQAKGDLDLGLKNSKGPGAELFLSESELFAKMAAIQDAVSLLPDSDPRRLYARSSSFFPKLRVVATERGSAPTGVPISEGERRASAQVDLFPYDWERKAFSGNASLSGSTDEVFEVPPGRYRILVVNQVGFAEISFNLLEWMRIYEVTAHLLPTPEVVRDMVRIPLSEISDASTEPGAFYIDPTEVTYAAYREFLNATGHRTPNYWPDPYDPRFDRLPIVGVTRLDATAFAEWSGKRLPSQDEWLRAARGPTTGSPDPSTDDAKRWPVVNVGPPPQPWVVNRPLDEELSELLLRLRPVGSSTGDVREEESEGASTAGGKLFDFYGNVSEWVDDVPVKNYGGKPFRAYADGFLMGSSWNRDRARSTFLAASYSLADISGMEPVNGFRCAKSVRN